MKSMKHLWLIGAAALVLLALLPDDAFAQRPPIGGGGFRGGAIGGGGFRGAAIGGGARGRLPWWGLAQGLGRVGLAGRRRTGPRPGDLGILQLPLLFRILRGALFRSLPRLERLYLG